MNLSLEQLITRLGSKEKIKSLSAKTIEVAKASPCRKRKVGAVLTLDGNIVSTGYNHNNDLPCEDINGTSLVTTHAEIDAIKKAKTKGNIMFITHPPCDACKATLQENNIDYYVVNEFMKWDDYKLKYSLIPPSTLKALAQVLTYGARKYKPNNWKNVEDTSVYWDALYRHLEAYRSGEYIDDESGFSHLAHAITNLAFLIELEGKNEVK